MNPKNWSPYGCHYFPDPRSFPSPKLETLPKEPLGTGEQYFLDLAGNIRKGMDKIKRIIGSVNINILSKKFFQDRLELVTPAIAVHSSDTSRKGLVAIKKALKSTSTN